MSCQWPHTMLLSPGNPNFLGYVCQSLFPNTFLSCIPLSPHVTTKCRYANSLLGCIWLEGHKVCMFNVYCISPFLLNPQIHTVRAVKLPHARAAFWNIGWLWLEVDKRMSLHTKYMEKVERCKEQSPSFYIAFMGLQINKNWKEKLP